MKKLFTFPMITMLVACGGAPTQNIVRGQIDDNTKFKIAPVSVEIESLCPAPSYPDSQKLGAIFQKMISDEFCAKQACTNKAGDNVVDIAIRIKYHRVFQGEGFACSESFSQSTMQWAADFTKNGVVLSNGEYSGVLTPSFGLFGNIGRIATQLSFTGGPEEEMNNIKAMTTGKNGISEGLSKTIDKLK